MLSKERCERAIHFNCPDYPPLLHGFAGGVILNDAEWALHICRKYPEDFGVEDEINLPFRDPNCYKKGHKFKDDWGVIREVSVNGIQGIVTIHPLFNWNEWPKYAPPVVEKECYRKLQTKIRKFSHSKYIAGDIPSLFETMQNLRGFENILCDLAEKSMKIKSLADMVFKIILKAENYLCETDCDCIRMCDDWGTQNSLIISPDSWRDFFKPYYAELVNVAHKHNKAFWLHSCGYVLPLFPDFIEIGVDLIHPQLELLSENEQFCDIIRGRICIVTDIDRTFFCRADPQKVYNRSLEVFQKIYQPEGGIILRAEIGVDVPSSNREAFYKACKDFQDRVHLTGT